MFLATKTPYKFKYLQTGISGEGIECVYLPETPTEDKILFKAEQKFIRPEMPEHLKRDYKTWKKHFDQGLDYVSIYSIERRNWEDQEWERTTDGIWFWNNGVATYITGFYYWYLTAWQTYFGYVDYRETDKELTYLLQFAEEDPDCFGILFNTIRRYGKSSLMGGWAIYRTTRNYGHYGGMQGEKDDKIAKFYSQMIRKPFLKLPYYFTPTYDTSTALTTEIKFEKIHKRGKKALIQEDGDQEDQLESVIDYRPSGEAQYDGSILHTYLCEEPGKLLQASVDERWKIVKPCLRKGRVIRGKAFMGTTVEFMDVTNRGGKAYKKLFYESDYNDKQVDGRTKSGLYAAFLPGDCAYEGFYDEWGHPFRDEAKKSLLQEREAVKDNPKDLSSLIRKYPLYIKEIFYINTDRCVFNATILQDRLSEINMSKEPFTNKFDLSWENGVRFSKVKWKHNPVNGWLQACWMPTEEEGNLVGTKIVGNTKKYYPKNQARFAAGVDPVDHRVIIENKSSDDDEVASTRRSRPVIFVRRKYDSSIDGELTQEILEERARTKFPYKTNKNVWMMDTRTGDPNVFYERCLLMCWLAGCELQCETQKPGVMNWFHLADCDMFLQQQYVSESNTKRINPYAEGTAASQTSINEYTDAKATHIEWFGHTIVFRELIEDDLVFNPAKTTVHDYSVADGWTDLACKSRPRTKEKPIIDIALLMPIFDTEGNLLN
jgi:predicted GIY-YIG superfamily endonuclease